MGARRGEQTGTRRVILVGQGRNLLGFGWLKSDALCACHGKRCSVFRLDVRMPSDIHQKGYSVTPWCLSVQSDTYISQRESEYPWRIQVRGRSGLGSALREKVGPQHPMGPECLVSQRHDPEFDLVPYHTASLRPDYYCIQSIKFQRTRTQTCRQRRIKDKLPPG